MPTILEDFEQLYWKRDKLKHDIGLEECERLFAEEYKNNPSNDAIALNYGICLFENQKSALAEGILGEICKPTGELKQTGRWFFEACKFYSESIKKRSEWDAAHALFSRVHLIEKPYANASINFILTHILSLGNFDYCRDEIKANYKHIAISDEAARKFFEIADALDKQEAYYQLIFIDNKKEFMQDIILTSLLYKFKFETSCREIEIPWHERYRNLQNSGHVPSPFDAYRLSTQLHRRLGHEAAAVEIERLCLLGDDYHACFWTLGAIQEASGNRNGAMESYRRAAKAELRANGVAYPLDDAPSPVKVSCIAICYNDEELVQHYCNMIHPHCDEIIVNDGGSTDNTILEFEKFASQTGFPVHIIRDRQANFRDRTIANKDSYRMAGKGGVEGFEADRRRITTLIAAQHPYILIADLDDYFPPFPNMKTIVTANFGVDSFAGSKREMLNENEYCDLYINRRSNMPTLFKRHRMHVFAGISQPDEYLSRLDHNLSLFAADFMQTCVTKSYHFWHLKWLLDDSKKMEAAPLLGPKYDVAGVAYPPDIPTIRKFKTDLSTRKNN